MEQIKKRFNDDKAKLNVKLSWQSYAIIAGIGIILFLVAFLIPEKLLAKSIFIGIATSCLSSVLIFVVLKFFMSSADDLLVDQIKDVASEIYATNAHTEKTNQKLIEKIDTFIKDSIRPSTTEEKEALYEFFDKLKTDRCDSIIMCGYSMAHVFNNYRNRFIELLNNNVDVKVLLVDPESSSGQLMRDKLNREGLAKLHPVGEPHIRALRYIHEKINGCMPDKENSPRITVSKVSWIPSVTLILASNRNSDYFVLLEGINGFMLSNKLSRRLYSIHTSTIRDKRIEFYESHFKALWDENISNIYSGLEGFLTQTKI